MDKLIIIACLAALLAQSMPAIRAGNSPSGGPAGPAGSSLEELEVERAILEAQAAGSLRAEPAASEESYQRVYEAFTKLMQSTTNNSLGNVRRLVARLNQLVGVPAQTGSAPTKQQVDERTEQILNRLDRVNKTTDQNTLRDLNEDVSRLISTLNDSYLRNIRRVIERVNKVVGPPAASEPAAPGPVAESSAFHQYGDRLDDPNQKQPGFPGWDEFIVAVDRMQKSLANFVRSSTRLVTSG